MEKTIKVEALSFRYDVDDILKAISVEVNQGTFVSILGPNGSGKTTLLKNICGLLKPHHGDIFLDDEKIKRFKHKELARQLAVVHQNFNTEFDFPVEDVVLMGRYPYIKKFEGETRRDIEIAEEAMALTSTTLLRHKNLKEISGGERQRVMIARALTQEPDILLLDEPISHLDIKYQLEVMQICQRLNQEKGLTILSTLHDINMASRFSDLIILMKAGEIVKIGEPQEVISQELIQYVYEVDVEIISGEGKAPIIMPI